MSLGDILQDWITVTVSHQADFALMGALHILYDRATI